MHRRARAGTCRTTTFNNNVPKLTSGSYAPLLLLLLLYYHPKMLLRTARGGRLTNRTLRGLKETVPRIAGRGSAAERAAGLPGVLEEEGRTRAPARQCGLPLVAS